MGWEKTVLMIGLLSSGIFSAGWSRVWLTVDRSCMHRVRIFYHICLSSGVAGLWLCYEQQCGHYTMCSCRTQPGEAVSCCESSQACAITFELLDTSALSPTSICQRWHAHPSSCRWVIEVGKRRWHIDGIPICSTELIHRCCLCRCFFRFLLGL
jgi:hypothetical protein